LARTIALPSRRVAQSAGPFPGGARRRATLPRGGARRRSGAVRNLADRAAPWPLVAGLAEIRAAHRARSRRPAGLFAPALAALARRKPATRVARAARRAGPRRSVAVLPFRRSLGEARPSRRVMDQAELATAAADRARHRARHHRPRGAARGRGYSPGGDDER